MNLKNKLTIIVILLFNISLFAQNSFLLKGNVVAQNDNSPIPGVSIIIKDTSKGTSTDFDGNFQLEVKTGDILQISFIGYMIQTITIKGQTVLKVVLTEDTQSLDEVVVIGYGTQKKSHLTGSISKVVNDELDQIAVSRVDDALVGQVSGVNISNTDGAVGSAPTIRIRGTGSITGDSGPLVVVDGMVMDSDILGNLDMNDIESFEVLKDAASAAIYGSRGGNGVIMITTKQGKEGDTKFSFSTYTGINEARQSKDYYFSVAESNAQELAATGTLSDKSIYRAMTGTDRDWQDELFNGGTITNYNISARGGSEKTKFSTALNYLHDEGVILTDDFKKYSIKVKVDTQVSEKFSFGVNITPTYTITRRVGQGLANVAKQSPWLPVYIDEYNIQFVDPLTFPDAKIGDYITEYMFDHYDLATGTPGIGTLNIGTTSNANAYAKIAEIDRNDYKFKVFSSAYIQFEIIEGLDFRSMVSNNFQNTERKMYRGTLYNRNGASAADMTYQNENSMTISTDNYFSYNKTIGKNDISAILGYYAESDKTTYSGIYATGYNNDFVKSINAAQTISAANELEWEQTLQSLISRVTYAYDDKYLASFSFRRDGSSVFGSDYKWGNFPAGSVGWRVSQEEFLKNSKVVSNLKLRASYGATGNTYVNVASSAVDNDNVLQNYYPSLALLSSQTYNNLGAFNPQNIANPDLQWERSIEFNPGIDFGLLNGTFTGSVDYYIRKSDQLLLNNPVSGTTGFSYALVNLGEVENEGFELEFRARIFNKEKFKWDATILSSWNKNTLVNFGASNGQIQSVDDKRAAEWINLEGNPISSFYGFVVDKEIPDEYINDPWARVGQQNESVYVKDLNGDGLIDADDKTILGDPYPDFIWSVSNSFTMGDFDFTFMFNGSHGAQTRNMDDTYQFQFETTGARYNPATTPDQQFIQNKIFTNAIVQDASYIALRNINLGFNFPKEFLDKIDMDKLRVYLTGSNLLFFTADNYSGWNPEYIDNTSPTTYGYQVGALPIIRTLAIGVNLDF